MKTAAVFIATAAIFALFVGEISGADKNGSNSLQSKLIREKDKLDRLRAKIKLQEKNFKSADKKESSIMQSLGGLDANLKLKEQELELLKWNMEINKENTEQLQKKTSAAQNVLNRQKIVLGKRLRTVYKEGSLFPLKVMFSAETINDLLRRVKYMETVAVFDGNLFSNYRDHLERLKSQDVKLKETRRRLALLENGTLEKRREISSDRTEKKRFLAKVRNNKALAAKARKEIDLSREKLNSIISGLERRLEKGDGLKFHETRGFLEPPAPGKLLNRFGRKRDKQYGSFIVYNGVNISVPKGAPVRAVFSGTVLFNGTLDGYGNLVILGHGDEYHTLYAHLDEALVSVGSTARKGQIIARSGDTGSLVGETLYFEMRHKGKPIEPTAWFKSTGKKKRNAAKSRG